MRADARRLLEAHRRPTRDGTAHVRAHEGRGRGAKEREQALHGALSLDRRVSGTWICLCVRSLCETSARASEHRGDINHTSAPDLDATRTQGCDAGRT